MRLLFTAGKDPGLVSDVLVVREDVIKSQPGQVLAMLKAWDAALKDYQAHTDEGQAIIADAVGSPVADPQDGVRRRALLFVGRGQGGAGG
jgi:NitT/TauT family transport system substrate-binding protein